MNQDKMLDCRIRWLCNTMRNHTALFLTDINAYFNQQHMNIRFAYLQPRVSTFKTNCGTYGVKNIADRIICKQDTIESDLSLRDYYKEDQYTQLYFDSFNSVLFNHNLKNIYLQLHVPENDIGLYVITAVLRQNAIVRLEAIQKKEQYK